MSYRQHQSPLVHRRTLSLAREYRSEGYDVTVYPKSGDLPEALAKCPLALIARNEERVVAIEVRTRESLTLNGRNDLRRIAETIKQIPDWIFELVVTNPRKSCHPD